MATTKNDLRLIKFQAESFAKIDKSDPVIIFFPEGYGGLMEAKGDEREGKTSLLLGLASVFGLPLPSNAVNKKDNDIKEELTFEKDKKTYRVKLLKNRFELSTLIDEKWATLDSPKKMLATLIGPVAQSPMFLKDYDGKKQIEWLRSFFQFSQEQLNFEKELDAKIKDAYDKRRNANRDLKKVEATLSTNDYYINRVAWKKKINDFKPGDAKKKIDEVGKSHAIYNNSIAEQKRLELFIPQLENDIVFIDEEIKELEEKIKSLHLKKENKGVELAQASERLTKFEKYIEDNKGIVKEFADISKISKEQSDMAVHKQMFTQMELEEKNSNSLHSEAIRLEKLLDEHKKLKKNFIAEFTPDIKGLEICIPDDEDPREGLYYNGMTPPELSESELWGLMTLLLQKLKVKILMVENIASLGSKAVEIFNKFIKAGGYIFASQMDRDLKDLVVTFYEKIE